MILARFVLENQKTENSTSLNTTLRMILEKEMATGIVLIEFFVDYSSQ